ncbi:hypothetical protein [Myroides sp. WP-1]|uniref:hypothetical protein n=1 Tax=Myroides sp. WP-1 TaxID=2759944 RepID=UPI0015F8506F|nr:hypothetical protein [Myroides sp. WP-1]MBB1139285.1 hypothetical protein [Myroides sp. WP-1]
MIAGGGLSGGISSTIAGGDFWQGMRQGLIVSGLNHAMHMGLDGLEQDKPKGKNNERENNDFSLDKLASDWEKNKEKSGYNHFKREGKKLYKQINKLGGYIILGSGGGLASSGNDIKGVHKIIEAKDMSNMGGGGAIVKGWLKLFQYLNAIPPVFANDKAKMTMIRQSNDTIFYKYREANSSRSYPVYVVMKKEE